MSNKGNFPSDFVEKAKAQFEECDENKDGMLDLEELKGVVKSLNPNMKTILLNNVASMKMKQGDKNKDDMIDFDEFLTLYNDMLIEKGQEGAGTPAGSKPGTPRQFGAKIVSVPDTIKRVADNDPEMTVLSLVGSASFQMKSEEYCKQLAAALKTNTYIKEVILNDLGISDAGAIHLSEAVAENSSITSLNLEKNNLDNDGGSALAKALAKNSTITEINLLQQKGRWGDACLDEFLHLFDSNITLIKITWRLESRVSFSINKKIIRNNDILKRKRDGKDVTDLLPEAMRPAGSATPAPAEAAPEATPEVPAEAEAAADKPEE